MTRPRGNTWTLPEPKLPGARKSHRRRLLNRLGRFASSPTLPTKPEDVEKHAVSFLSLHQAQSSAVRTPDSESSTEFFVDCEEGNRGPQWEDFPEEIKMQVLGFMSPLELIRCSAVSKEFRRLSRDGQLWSTFDASGFYQNIPVEQLAEMIVSAGPFVRHLNLRGCVQLRNDWRIETVANSCRNLLSASLEGCKFERSIVHFIITRNPQLVHVNLSGLMAVTNSTCRMLAQSCPNIESLNVSFCTEVDGRGLRRVAEACRNLRELRACELNINDLGLMQALFTTNTIERLHFCDSVNVTDEHIRVLVEGLDADIDPFTHRNLAPPRKLLYLDLGRCKQITDRAMHHLAGNVPELTRLDLGDVIALTDRGMAALLHTVPKLEYLDLEDCFHVTNTTLLNIAKSRMAKSLLHLQVSYCEGMSDAGMVELLKKCEKLRNLELDNTRVTDLTLAAASCVRKRSTTEPTSHSASNVALRMVVFDCANITWTGICEVLSRNAEHMKEEPNKPGLVQLKCSYDHQKTVDQHTKMLLQKDFAGAERIERLWAEKMMLREEQVAGGRRRRRGRRDLTWDDDGRSVGRNARCAIM